ncbi:MAG: hypothetical protein LBS89_06805 [Zoogloeaceae bacterium]|jgi:hypothetical protein|nr:hypothetical protein [Zoogloeaceae bacterium]
MQFPVLIELRRSRFFLLWLLVTHGLAALGLWLTPWPLWVSALLSLVLAAVLYQALKQWHALPARLTLHPGGRLTIGAQKHASPLPDRPALLLPNAMTLPLLCVFAWQEETQTGRHKRQSLPLFFDSADPESLRRLRVWLRAGTKERR